MYVRLGNVCYFANVKEDPWKAYIKYVHRGIASNIFFKFFCLQRLHWIIFSFFLLLKYSVGQNTDVKWCSSSKCTGATGLTRLLQMIKQWNKFAQEKGKVRKGEKEWRTGLSLPPFKSVHLWQWQFGPLERFLHIVSVLLTGRCG